MACGRESAERCIATIDALPVGLVEADRMLTAKAVVNEKRVTCGIIALAALPAVSHRPSSLFETVSVGYPLHVLPST